MFICSRREIQETCCHEKECVENMKLTKISENIHQELYMGNKGVLGIPKPKEPLCGNCETCLNEVTDNREK